MTKSPENIHPNCEPVIWRGKVYLSQKLVAKAAGVVPGTVACHLLRHGHLENLGIGRGRHCNHARTASKPIGTWPSQAALARAAGIKPKALNKWVRHGKSEKILLAMMRADATRRADQ